MEQGLIAYLQNLTGVVAGSKQHTIYAQESQKFIGGIITYLHMLGPHLQKFQSILCPSLEKAQFPKRQYLIGLVAWIGAWGRVLPFAPFKLHSLERAKGKTRPHAKKKSRV